ncbi:hydroxymethylglutaryl-CoA lyase [Gordonia humi]|nr:hydroxymethylglutaryl-CoA lyase [Gordonia humi]
MRSVALVPNARGLDRALASGIGEIAVFASATQTFAEKNLNADRDTALRRASTIARSASAVGLAVRGYVSMAFGDPWEGDVDPEQVADCAMSLLESGCDSISIADTIGVGTPGDVDAVVDAILDAGGNADQLAMHLHDTYGQGLANVHTSLQAGIAEFDTSAGGIGRCPYARGATGNLATEDLVWMLDGMGIETGIDVHALAATSRWLCNRTGIANASSVAKALLTRTE